MKFNIPTYISKPITALGLTALSLTTYSCKEEKVSNADLLKKMEQMMESGKYTTNEINIYYMKSCNCDDLYIKPKQTKKGKDKTKPSPSTKKNNSEDPSIIESQQQYINDLLDENDFLRNNSGFDMSKVQVDYDERNKDLYVNPECITLEKEGTNNEYKK